MRAFPSNRDAACIKGDLRRFAEISPFRERTKVRFTLRSPKSSNQIPKPNRIVLTGHVRQRVIEPRFVWDRREERVIRTGSGERLPGAPADAYKSAAEPTPLKNLVGSLGRSRQ